MFAWLFGSSTKPPILLKLRSSRTFILVTVSTAIFTDLFAYGIIVPVLPFALTSRASVNPDDIQTWIAILLAVYGAALLVASPFLGWVADRLSSRRVPLIAGLLALGGSTVMLCLGRSIAVLVAARVLQGISAAVVWTVGMALIVDTVGPDEVGAAMGYIGLSMSLAVLLAPLLGGIVFEAANYYSVYAMAFGLIVLDIILRLAMVEKKVADLYLPRENHVTTEKSEEPGLDQTLTDNNEGISEDLRVTEETAIKETSGEAKCDAESPETSLQTDPTASAVDPAPARKFINRLPSIFILFTSRRLLAALWASVIQSTLLTAFDSVLPLFVRNTFHWNSIGAGLIFLPMIVPTFIGPLVGWGSDKYGPRWFAVAGFFFSCPCIILLRLIQYDTIGQKVLMCALLALLGLCLTFVLTPIMAEITYAVDAKARERPHGFFGKNGAFAQAYSLFNMAWAAGSLIGPLLGGLINQAGGWGTATLILGIVSVVTTIPVAIWTGGSIFKKRRAHRLEAQANV